MRPLFLFAAAALLAASLPPLQAQAPAAPGARPGDAELTCQAIAAERSDIAAAEAQRLTAKASGSRARHAMFGFAKALAGQVVPGQALGLGGIGGQAAYLATGQAISAVGEGGTAAAPAPNPAQAERLAQLQSLAALHQCAA